MTFTFPSESAFTFAGIRSPPLRSSSDVRMQPELAADNRSEPTFYFHQKGAPPSCGGRCFRLVRIRYPGESWTVMPFTSGLLFLALTRFSACVQFSRTQTSSGNCSMMAGLSVRRFPALPEDTSGLHPYPSPGRPTLAGSSAACRASVAVLTRHSHYPSSEGPFGPSSAAGLLRPLPTSAARPGSVTRPSVRFPGQTADLPK